MHTNNVVSDNLPIYFIWFGSDVPPKYFGNLQRAAETNKSRDIILVYSEKHLPQNNRKNINSIESMSIDKIKKRIKLKKDSRTRNLFKIDVYDMELDKRIYDLFNKVFKIRYLNNDQEQVSFKYCVASDLIRLPLLNITGGIYLDMDTEVIDEVGKIETKNGYNINYYYPEGSKDPNITGNIIAKAQFCSSKKSKESEFSEEISFQKLMEKYIEDVSKVINNKYENNGTDPVNYLFGYIKRHYIKSYFSTYLSSKAQEIKSYFSIYIDSKI